MLLELAIALVSEAASVLWWLSDKEKLLVTHRGDQVTCSTGVMQGCPFAVIAVALVVQWLTAQMTHSGLDEKQFFIDDGLLYGTPETIKWCLDLIERLEPVKWTKMSVHAPTETNAQTCRRLLPKALRSLKTRI